MGTMRLTEIAEKAMSWLDDHGELQDFCEDLDIELTDEEKEWFGVAEYKEED